MSTSIPTFVLPALKKRDRKAIRPKRRTDKGHCGPHVIAEVRIQVAKAKERGWVKCARGNRDARECDNLSRAREEFLQMIDKKSRSNYIPSKTRCFYTQTNNMCKRARFAFGNKKNIYVAYISARKKLCSPPSILACDISRCKAQAKCYIL